METQNLPLARALLSQRFFVLLAALIGMLLMMPLLEPFTDLSPGLAFAATSIAFFSVLFSAIFAVSDSRWTRIGAFIWIGAYVVLRLIGWVTNSVGVYIAENVVFAAFLAITVILILKHLFHTRDVTPNMISASLCAYFMLAFLWATLYASVELVDPGAFRFPDGVVAQERSMQSTGEMSGYAVYYSLVTLTTLGYGDITPVSSAARSLSVVEAAIGQIYLAVLVASLVGRSARK